MKHFAGQKFTPYGTDSQGLVIAVTKTHCTWKYAHSKEIYSGTHAELNAIMGISSHV